MKSVLFKSLVSGGTAAVAAIALSAAPASAETSTANFRADLGELNGSGTTGYADVSVTGDQATVILHTFGASAGVPHAQHIHIGGTDQCPTLANDTNGDGFISVPEGVPSYGGINVSLTTSGDVSAASGLAVDRFPAGNPNEEVQYARTFTLPKGLTASDIAKGVVVQHGSSKFFDSPTAYDGAKKSELDPALPFEATAPVACGKLMAVTNTASGAAKDFAASINASATAFSNSGSAAVTKLPAGAATDQFAMTANGATAAYMQEVQAALDAFNQAAVSGSSKGAAAKDQFINSFNASKDKLFNTWSQARNTLVDNLNRSGNGEASNRFSASYNAFSAQLGSSLEIAKNAFADQVK